jgi:hypothetical protein
LTEDVIKELEKESGELSDFHKELLDHVMKLVKMSRSSMCKSYTDWDNQQMIYKGERLPDKDDVEQSRRDKPVKMVVPTTFAQVMTFSSFLFMLFTQNRTFYELVPTGDEDYGTKYRDCEMLLERDTKANQWNSLLFQHLLDTARYGMGVLECCWTKKLSRIYVPAEPTVINVAGVESEVKGGSEWQEFVKFEGNLVRAISPYRWFPDTRFALTDFQRGEFCACEEEYSKTLLQDLEEAGEVAGVEWIRPLPKSLDKSRGGPTRTQSAILSGTSGNNVIQGPRGSATGSMEGTILVTKVQVWIVPSKFKFGPKDQKLGPEEFPVLYHVWYANDNRLIRIEPTYNWHNEFGWTLAQFTPDMSQTVSMGLADLIYRLQDVITWLVNARVTDVRRNLRGRNLVNPTIVDTKTLDGEGDIYLRKGANAAMMERAIRPLDVNNVTQGHFTDADTLNKIIQVVTGVNDNAMGSYNSGRRSATEARSVTAGAASRMKMHGQLIWETSLGRLGRLMLSNLRQSLSQESFALTIGKDPMIQQRYALFKGTPQEVINGADFFTFDSTLQSEKGFIAQSLQELLIAVINNPVAAQQLDIDPRAMLEEIQYLRGVGNVGRFSLSQRVASGQAPPLPPAVLPGPPGGQPQPQPQTGPPAAAA